MVERNCPILRGTALFRKNELVYVNRSDELKEYCGVIHRHDFIEIAYVIEGNGIHVVGDREYEILKGDLFVINYDTPHGFFAGKGRGTEPVVYNCDFMPEFLDSSLFTGIHFQDTASSFLFKSLFPDDCLPTPDLRLRDVQFNEIGDLFDRMYREYKLMQKGCCDMIRAYLIQLIIKIFRYMDQDTPAAPESRNIELVNKAIEYLRFNFNSDVSLQEMAMKSFISKNYFSRLFKEVTGTSFSDYVQHLRVDQACSLLRQSDMKVVDVASRSGFNDIKFFYEVFKKITGETPGDYRNKQKCL